MAYLVNNQILDKSADSFNSALVSAYEKKSRPECLCRSPGIPMYIARTDDLYILKRMPNSGNLHDVSCDSYEIPLELSGRGDVEDNAIQEDSDTGITNLRLDFSLSKLASSKVIEKGSGAEIQSIQANPKKLSIRSLLHVLYEDAGLNKWSPAMGGKRNWFIIRKYLLHAATNKTASRSSLIDYLLVPEVFRVDDKDGIISRRRKFFETLKPKDGRQGLGIVIGEVKAFDNARFGHKLTIKHIPDTPFYMGEDVLKRINRNFAPEIALFSENETIHLIAIATFTISASGNPQIDTISFMLADTNWIPFESIEELSLIERLVTGQRGFIKGLRYNLSSTDVVASALLTDIKDNPVAIYHVPVGSGDSYLEEIESIVESSNVDSRVWDLNEGSPLLLPSAST